MTKQQEANRKAFAMGRNSFRGDVVKFEDAAQQAEYARGYWMARSDEGLDEDREWDR